MHPSVREVLLAVALSCIASPMLPAEPRIHLAPHRTLHAGDVVTVAWSGLPDDVDEFEFLLRHDDGDVVRLTEQLQPSGASFRWTVPDLPSLRATLLLRAGIDGRERTLACSEPFVIRGTGGARLEFRNGEWWSLDLQPPKSDAPRMSFQPTSGTTRVATSARRPLLAGRRVAFGHAQPLQERPRHAVAANTRCGAPRTVPQRK